MISGARAGLALCIALGVTAPGAQAAEAQSSESPSQWVMLYQAISTSCYVDWHVGSWPRRSIKIFPDVAACPLPGVMQCGCCWGCLELRLLWKDWRVTEGLELSPGCDACKSAGSLLVPVQEAKQHPSTSSQRHCQLEERYWPACYFACMLPHAGKRNNTISAGVDWYYSLSQTLLRRDFSLRWSRE